ncbi:MAG: MEMO1 family protein, partial [Chloroflexota bacterium]|nr:MEMO1 family protein [Chloroflexota bacterium]
MATSFPLAEQPRLRPVEIFPVDDGREGALVLRDPADPELRPLIVSMAAAELLMLLDGQRTPEGVSVALQVRGVSVTSWQVREFLQRLDEAGYLEGPRAAQRAQERRRRFLALPTRVAAHAGGAYASDEEDLGRMIADGYQHPDGPGALAREPPKHSIPPRAVIAPHVDLHRGAPTYSWAYHAIAEAPPADLYVILGTCHTGVPGGFAATAKPYDTP